MRDEFRVLGESAPDPSPAIIPIDAAQLDRIDDSLHFGWSWHRHRFCYRRGDGIRTLDAGCGTGLSTLGLAKLNPAASAVIGVDGSPHPLDLARERARADGNERVEFREHDLEQPLPAAWGAFDFITCRRVLGQVDDPRLVLENLARALDPRGLLFVTFPSRSGRQPARQMRRAIEALATPEMDSSRRAELGLELFRALRPDHPIRHYDASQGGDPANPDRFRSLYLGPHEREFDLPEALALIESTGLQFLFSPTRWPWQAARVFSGQVVADDLKARVDALAPRRLAELIDALDPALHFDEYRIYACLADHEPRLPTWPDDRRTSPEVIDRLIPHLTGLAERSASGSPTPGKVRYNTITGAAGDLDPRADLLLREVDGQADCGTIDERVSGREGVSEDHVLRRQRWVELANNGFILLEATDPRQNVDCQHLGPIRDRLDCACPRRWVRACEVHGSCTISPVPPGSESYQALQEALGRLGLERVIACAECPDYAPDEG